MINNEAFCQLVSDVNNFAGEGVESDYNHFVPSFEDFRTSGLPDGGEGCLDDKLDLRKKF